MTIRIYYSKKQNNTIKNKQTTGSQISDFEVSRYSYTHISTPKGLRQNFPGQKFF